MRFLLCFYLWNNPETVILLHWPRVSDCILYWPFGQYSSVMIYVMLVTDKFIKVDAQKVET